MTAPSPSPAPRCFPAPGEDPQALPRATVVARLTQAIARPEANEYALRDALEILASDQDGYDTFAQRAPFQCAHCGAVLHTATARRVHFGETPQEIPLCLAPQAARELLEQARRLALFESLDCPPTPGDVERLRALIETACAASHPDAPRSAPEAIDPDKQAAAERARKANLLTAAPADPEGRN
jgi:hypothetical protein